VVSTNPRTSIDLGRRVGAASRVEMEYFCRGCKGHYAATVPLATLSQASCRCGSGDLLVYSVSGEFSSPMRSMRRR
jgi:hypothetical protein